jgi:nucleotide-binding universal stress UspA family protein
MQRILVPCDFSEPAKGAFRLAIEMAHKFSAEVHVLNVIELPIMHDDVLTPMPSFDERLLQELSERSEERFAELKSEVAMEHLFIETKIEFGPIVPTILDYISDNKVTLIVMGTKGVTGLAEVFIGSTAEKVVRHAPCPVIAVKRGVSIDDLRHIVFPNSLEEGQEDLILHVKALQHALEATLHLVWIETSTKASDHAEIKQRMDAFAKRFMLKDYTLNVFKSNSKETGIIKFTQWINATMIAMGTHARKGLSHLFKGSITEGIVNHVEYPIWTYAIKADSSQRTADS